MRNPGSIPAPNPPFGIKALFRPREHSRRDHLPARVFWGTLLFIALHFVVALAFLWQWGTPRPWSRVDIFSGGFLLISLMWVYATMQFHRTIFRSREVMREAAGLTFDSEMLTWINAFGIAELSVFADYGHWHLCPPAREARSAIRRPRHVLPRRRLAHLDRPPSLSPVSGRLVQPKNAHQRTLPVRAPSPLCRAPRLAYRFSL